MKVRILIILALVVIVGGGFLVIKLTQEKAPEVKKSDFLKNDLKNLDVNDGEKF
jgi:hypothetical protein